MLCRGDKMTMFMFKMASSRHEIINLPWVALSLYHQSKRADTCAKSLAKVVTNVPYNSEIVTFYLDDLKILAKGPEPRLYEAPEFSWSII